MFIIRQVFPDDGRDLFAIVADGLRTDVVDVVQVGVIVVDVCHGREIEAGDRIAHDVEIRTVGHSLIDHVRDGIAERITGMVGIELNQVFITR